ncbi:MAG: hypothetical protein AABX47_07920 [Nanoarchaeota archaeon]
MIDTHVHCRDGEQSYKETIPHALSVADRAGYTMIMDIPNLKVPVTGREGALRRLDIAEKAKSNVIYGMYLILTKDPAQIKEAVAAYNELKYRQGCRTFVAGLKLFAGQSTGDSGIVEPSDQFKVYQCVSGEGFDGVTLVHCEMESDFAKEAWDHNEPITHAYARPWKSEVSSVNAQIINSVRAGYTGRLHIAHVSVPRALDLVEMAHSMGVRIAAEITPHHRLFDLSVMSRPDGLNYKMNPPLRSKEMAYGLHQFLVDERMDYVWIASDHAPHTLKEKMEPPHDSGIPGLYFIPKFARILEKMGVSKKRVEDLTFNNAAKAFGLTGLKPRRVVVLEETLKKLAAEYEFDPYHEFWTMR